MCKHLKRTAALCLCLVLCLALFPPTEARAESFWYINDIFPDEHFRDYAKTFDLDSDGKLTQTELDAVTDIDVSGKDIESLAGLKYFRKLETLSCRSNKLTKLELSGNPSLKSLLCSENPLKTLDLSKNPDLEMVECMKNQLTSLDLSKNQKLFIAVCGGNEIETLDISHNPLLCEAYVNGELTEGNYLSVKFDMYSYQDGSEIYMLGVDSTTKVTATLHVITAQPKDMTVKEGEKVTFTVEAQGENLKYQWYLQEKGSDDWSFFAGERKSTLTFVADPEQDGTKYRCKVSSEKGSETSEAAALTVKYKPRITVQPKDKSVRSGKKATFKVKAVGVGVKYRWFYQKPGTTKWVKVKGGTKATLKVTAKKKMNGYKYRCKVYNDVGKVYTKTVKLKVKK